MHAPLIRPIALALFAGLPFAAHGEWVDYAQADTSAAATTFVVVGAVGASDATRPAPLVSATYARWDTARRPASATPTAGRSPAIRIAGWSVPASASTGTTTATRAATRTRPRHRHVFNPNGSARRRGATTTRWPRLRAFETAGCWRGSTHRRRSRSPQSGRATTSVATRRPASAHASRSAWRAGSCASAPPARTANSNRTSASPTTRSEAASAGAPQRQHGVGAAERERARQHRAHRRRRARATFGT